MARKAQPRRRKGAVARGDDARRWSLNYTQVTVRAAPGDVFWTAVALARWSGSAFVDFEELSLAYSEGRPGGRPGHDVSIVCTASSATETVLEVHVHKTAYADRYTLASDVAKEKQIADRIVRALRWSEAQWREIPLEAKYHDVTGSLAIEVSPADAQVTVNGVVAETANGVATVKVKPGHYVAELRKEGYYPDRVGTYFAVVDELPSLIVFTTVVAPPRPRIPPVIPRPPVPPGTGTGARVAGKLGVRVLARAAIPVAVALDAYAIYEAQKLWRALRRIRVDVQDFERSCCCTWTRTDRIGGPLVRVSLNMSIQHYEDFRRRFNRTVVRPPGVAPCPCGPPPAFTTSWSMSEYIMPGRVVALPAGPPTGGAPTVIPAVRCPAEGESPATSTGFGILNIPHN